MESKFELNDTVWIITINEHGSRKYGKKLFDSMDAAKGFVTAITKYEEKKQIHFKYEIVFCQISNTDCISMKEHELFHSREEALSYGIHVLTKEIQK